jgi:hypothetical protein
MIWFGFSLSDLNEMDIAEARHWIDVGARYLSESGLAGKESE